MKKIVIALVSLSFFSAANAADFTISSPNIEDGKLMPKAQELNMMDCNGQNMFPGLEWKNAPKGTKSYAITVYDPDAPTGHGWWHWSAFNIPAGTKRLEAAEGKSIKLPEGTIQNKADFDFTGFGGACPPKGHGVHHYHFTIYALDTDKLDADKSTYVADLVQKIKPHVLGKAEFVSLYKR